MNAQVIDWMDGRVFEWMGVEEYVDANSGWIDE